jgi:hypothetical protein
MTGAGGTPLRQLCRVAEPLGLNLHVAAPSGVSKVRRVWLLLCLPSTRLTECIRSERTHGGPFLTQGKLVRLIPDYPETPVGSKVCMESPPQSAWA